ncbi:hypothetical protein SDC9_71610 [bioreactor metagenome]|uniref:Uncharacterized protein n=1 Tax=bioreactor metagenome TaxID=1076179 RepID=A0A644Y9F1_9ZZZZ
MCSVVNECTGLHISVCVDVQVASSSGYASVYIFSVIPEIKSEQRLCLSELSYLVVHELTLRSGCKKFSDSVLPYRHVSEKPCKLSSFFYHVVKILFAAYDICIFACIAA